MKIKINETIVKVEFVAQLSDENMLSIFEDKTRTIRIVANNNDKRQSIIYIVTYAYLFYYGFTNADLNAAIVCNFMEIYGERIIKQADEIMLNLEWS